MLSPLPLGCEHARDLEEARARITDRPCAAILTATRLSDGSWLDVLNVARDLLPEVPVIVTDALADTRFWAEALNLGAYDVVVQPFSEAEVRRILGNACARVIAGSAAPRFYNGFSTRRNLCPQPPTHS
jgi:DNA-binding NtrC family response regulator